MTLYRRRSDGEVLVPVRTERRLDLRSLTLLMYHSNELVDADPKVDEIRRIIADVLSYAGSDVFVRISDNIREAREFDSDRAEVRERLEWARRLVVKAYRREFKRFPETLETLRAFEALDVEEIS